MVATNGDAGVRDRGRASSPHTDAAYAGALQRLGAWLDGRPLDARPLDDRNLAAYLRTLQRADRARATAAVVVSAIRRATRGAASGRRTARGPGGRSRASADGRPPRGAAAWRAA